MSDVTVEQFAEVLKVPVDKLLAQLEEAGITSLGPKDRISEDAKHELLAHLRKAHGKAEDGGAPRKITLRRKAQSEIKVAAPLGKARTVSVEVRRKRTYIKRDVLEEQARVAQEAARPAARGRETRSALAAEQSSRRDARWNARAAAPRARGERAPHRRRGYEAPGRGTDAPRGRAEGARAGREGAPRARGKGAQAGRGRQEHPLRPPGTAHRGRTVRATQERPLAARAAPARRQRQRGPQARFRAADRSRCSARSRSARPSRSPSSPSAWRSSRAKS